MINDTWTCAPERLDYSPPLSPFEIASAVPIVGPTTTSRAPTQLQYCLLHGREQGADGGCICRRWHRAWTLGAGRGWSAFYAFYMECAQTHFNIINNRIEEYFLTFIFVHGIMLTMMLQLNLHQWRFSWKDSVFMPYLRQSFQQFFSVTFVPVSKEKFQPSIQGCFPLAVLMNLCNPAFDQIHCWICWIGKNMQKNMQNMSKNVQNMQDVMQNM